MKFLADENISHLTIKFLNELGYDTKSVPLKGSTDEEVIDLAIKGDRFVITLDLDFGQIYFPRKRGLEQLF